MFNIKKVFLGGTCNESKWRDALTQILDIDYFNPVVYDWTEECYQYELRQRKECDYCLYVITPRMTGVYSIAEVIDDSNKRPERTIFCYIERDAGAYRTKDKVVKRFVNQFDEGQLKSLDRVGRMVESNGGKYFKSLEEVAKYLNSNR